MKISLTILFALYTTLAVAQDKVNYMAYNKITELKGTNYVIASIENRTKMFVESRFLLFINTVTGESRQVDFPRDAFIQSVEQLKLDSLGINKVIVSANTVNLDGDKFIDYNDPKQVIILSPDGSERTQVTEDRFFASSWMINRQTGTIVITGYYDSNGNGKYDKTDQGQIILYSLKTMSVIKKL